jgi:hypothetical protein
VIYAHWAIPDLHGIRADEIPGLGFQEVFRCPRCEKISAHPTDLEYGWCGACFCLHPGEAGAMDQPDRRDLAATLQHAPTLVYFGERWDAPVFDDTDARQFPTPVGEPCLLCEEAVVDGDRGFLRVVVRSIGPGMTSTEMLPVHRECDLRNVVGGLDHLQGRCQHTGHCNQLREQAGRSLREDALAVWTWVQEHGVLRQ